MKAMRRLTAALRIARLRQMGFGFILPNRAKGPLLSCVMAFQSRGTRGGINSRRWQPQDFTPLPPICGYGQSGRPEAIDQYTLLHHVGDMVGVLTRLARNKQ